MNNYDQMILSFRLEFLSNKSKQLVSLLLLIFAKYSVTSPLPFYIVMQSFQNLGNIHEDAKIQ